MLTPIVMFMLGQNQIAHGDGNSSETSSTQSLVLGDSTGHQDSSFIQEDIMIVTTVAVIIVVIIVLLAIWPVRQQTKRKAK